MPKHQNENISSRESQVYHLAQDVNSIYKVKGLIDVYVYFIYTWLRYLQFLQNWNSIEYMKSVIQGIFFQNSKNKN